MIFQKINQAFVGLVIIQLKPFFNAFFLNKSMFMASYKTRLVLNAF